MEILKKIRDSKAVRALGLVALLSLPIACSSTASTEAAKAPTVSGTYKADGGQWTITGDGPFTAEEAQNGDTLLSLARESGTELRQPSEMSERAIPLGAFEDALAAANNQLNPGREILDPN